MSTNNRESIGRFAYLAVRATGGNVVGLAVRVRGHTDDGDVLVKERLAVEVRKTPNYSGSGSQQRQTTRSWLPQHTYLYLQHALHGDVSMKPSRCTLAS